VWDDKVAENQRIELEEANVSEKELWTELLRLARTNFSEAYMVLTHLKVIRSFVESVLRYGLPAEYFGIAVKVRKKTARVCESMHHLCLMSCFFSSSSPIQSEQRRFCQRLYHTIPILPDHLLTRRMEE